mgnify:CR=1 FL=1
MSEAVIFPITEDIHGSVIPTPAGDFLLSVFHAPTGRALYGREPTEDRALGWLEGAKLVFSEPEGSA